MPKLSTDSRVGTYFNSVGRISHIDSWLNQSVLTGSSPTFANLFLTSNATIDGNLYVNGSLSVFKQETFFDNNFIVLNSSSGSLVNESGILIDRGPSLPDFKFVFSEPTNTFRIGTNNSTQPVSTREDTPLPYGLATWNPSLFRFDSLNYSNIPFSFNSSLNSTNLSTSALSIPYGGLTIGKDTLLGGNLSFSKNGTTSSYISLDSYNNLSIFSSYNILFDSSSAVFNNTLYAGSDLIVNNSLRSQSLHSSSLLISNTLNNLLQVDSSNTTIYTDLLLSTTSTTGFTITNSSTNLFHVDSSTGTVSIYNNIDSTGISTGGLLINSGVSINKSTSINGNLNLFNNLNISYGNIYLNGQAVSFPILSSPILSFIDTSQVSSLSYGNVKLINISNNSRQLTFSLSLFPLFNNSITKLSFSIPNFSSSFSSITDINAQVSAFTSNTCLFNTFLYSNINTNTATLQFQSSLNTQLHYFPINLFY